MFFVNMKIFEYPYQRFLFRAQPDSLAIFTKPW